MKLFVYGSLLREMSLSSYMKKSTFLGPAFVKANMFYLGFYPGIVKGNNTVFGELYEVKKSQLPLIDEVEDYIELDSQRSSYLRKPVEAFRLSDGKKVNAEAYFYNRTPEGKLLIASGDYRQFMTESVSKDNWLIAYGSYMSSETMFGLLGTVPEYKKGFVNEFKRVYKVATGINGKAIANLEFKSKTRCEAVAWKVSRQQAKVLDKAGQTGINYFRISMPFTTLDGATLKAQAYLAKTKSIKANLPPDPDYLKK